jgi:hypothetical protein
MMHLETTMVIRTATSSDQSRRPIEPRHKSFPWNANDINLYWYMLACFDVGQESNILHRKWPIYNDHIAFQCGDFSIVLYLSSFPLYAPTTAGWPPPSSSQSTNVKAEILLHFSCKSCQYTFTEQLALTCDVFFYFGIIFNLANVNFHPIMNMMPTLHLYLYLPIRFFLIISITSVSFGELYCLE